MDRFLDATLASGCGALEVDLETDLVDGSATRRRRLFVLVVVVVKVLAAVLAVDQAVGGFVRVAAHVAFVVVLVVLVDVIGVVEFRVVVVVVVVAVDGDAAWSRVASSLWRVASCYSCC